MGVSRLFGLCAAFLFAAPVSAAVTIDLGPTDWRRVGPNGSHTPNGIRSSIDQPVRIPPTNSTLTVTRNPVVPYGSLGGALRTIGRASPGAIAASAAMAALFAAMDWVLDQGVWKKEDLMDETDPYGYTFSAPGGGGIFPNARDACLAGAHNSSIGTRDLVSVNTNPNGTISCVYVNWHNTGNVAYNAQRSGGGCSEGFTYVVVPGVTAGCYKYGLVPLTDFDYSQLTARLPTLPASDVAGAAGDAQRHLGGPLPGYHDTQMSGPSSVSGPETTTTSTDPVTGDTTVTTTQTTTNITYGDTTLTTTNTTVTNTYVNGTHTKTETTTETPGELPVDGTGDSPSASEWPGFCDWASIVCDWIDWTREEPDAEPDLPEVMDDDFYEQKSIQFGAKTCPPDYEINIAFLDTTVGVSMQPLCDFAAIIYYMVMAAAYIIAAYISIGVVRNG